MATKAKKSMKNQSKIESVKYKQNVKLGESGEIESENENAYQNVGSGASLKNAHKYGRQRIGVGSRIRGVHRGCLEAFRLVRGRRKMTSQNVKRINSRIFA